LHATDEDTPDAARASAAGARRRAAQPSRTRALLREPGPSYARCTVRAAPRPSLDWERAREQHRALVGLLHVLDVTTRVLPALEVFPDSVFIEDTALILGDLAVICPFSVASRAGEERETEGALAQDLCVHRLSAGTLDGGDCLVTDREVLVGLSSRSSGAAVAALEALCRDAGSRLRARPIALPRSLLHLKCAASYLGTPRGEPTILLAAHQIDTAELTGYRVLRAPLGEEPATNCVAIGEDVIVASGFPRTAELLAREGFRVHPLDISELAKGDGSVSCLSLLWRRRAIA
jgi:dimethylargininase